MKTIAQYFAVCLLARFYLSIPARAQVVTLRGRVELTNPAKSRKPSDNSNAVVWLMPAAAIQHPPLNDASRRRFRLIQQRKRFEPHVLVVPVGSVVEFPNLDPFFHNVFSLFDGKRFDLGLYEAGTTHAVSFDRPGISYIFCNIHPEMSTVVVAVDTPYYGISSRSGDITIRNVPSGEYQLQAWHERCSPEAVKRLGREISVSAEEHSLGTLRLPESADLIARHKNKYDKDYIPPNPPGPLYEQP